MLLKFTQWFNCIIFQFAWGVNTKRNLQQGNPDAFLSKNAKLINPTLLPLPLENDTMGYYEAPTLHVNYEFRENPTEWHKIPHLYHMKEDVKLALREQVYIQPDTIAEAVFGRQKEEKSVSLEHHVTET